MTVLIPAIMCGGSGSRLWPVSREQHPKPFIKLSDNQSFLQKAFLRGAKLSDVSEVLTITNRDLYFKTLDSFKEVNSNEIQTSFILEPYGRNTAAAVASAAIYARDTYGDDAVLLVLAADHLITEQVAFDDAVSCAIELAKAGRLVTFGIKPTIPETGYGYIEALGTEVLRFVEKPTLDKAIEYVESGRFFWNSGMFCFKASTMIAEMDLHCPEVLIATKACLDKSDSVQSKKVKHIDLDPDTFIHVPDISIDYAVMEKSGNVSVVPCDIGWSDIGSWAAISELHQADDDGNTVQGHAILHATSNCYISSEDRVIGAVGVENLVIVDTADALLVAHKESSQDVKLIYNHLKTINNDAYKIHRTVYCPWGRYTLLEVGERFKIKRLEVKPGASLTMQMHHHRNEHWVVLSGVAEVFYEDQIALLTANQSTYIPAGHRHQLKNPGLIDLVMLEVQTGEYLGEDDIIDY
ncbi:mannose-1-phosphate guanylyltransferase/mannose-6-phosphate isomerase [Aeromonas sp. HMWF036]|uniref:mannose-1-phosphate guanylyltransferase n=1 Tax=Aeromonas hydrophila TaxID=644 RepID=A0A346AD37_AERHY|nr:MULTISPECIES: mannose-1-phosphate guanylyltransferase/mannose-6-phosphate isomerase [Aeromonas]AXL05149.1 mannose-1-phosphate guanylyltransferase [Aeromonas hydrophila]MCF5727371.1 mannose-1-phosphate guanylyltransferase/mannose-6-phosphate isomerase [Aeromonas veronii]PTS80592.1 mannose-1-phosphate guanylyltransferase/mannose-6-phosphate isomerase [Aeromonas sp. HMWF036]PTT23657.1 mannose-1-phosphate guanylyltransferase/mannose-6-phosphate isomerase [Aeromonas sp. HMWF017]QWZ83165.1 mannos